MPSRKKTPEQIEIIKRENRLISQYERTLKTHIVTSRFNTSTREQNRRYRERKNHKGCIYCAPVLLTRKIPPQSNVVVLEMDNDTNRIFAIGLIINTPHFSKYQVYNDYNYNHYNYTGKYRIERTELTEDEDRIIKIFDQLCFRGSMHQKRGHGLTAFPTKILWRCKETVDLVKFMEDLFKRYICTRPSMKDEKV